MKARRISKREATVRDRYTRIRGHAKIGAVPAAWQVCLVVDQQMFAIGANHDNLAEARWHRRQLVIALARLVKHEQQQAG